MAATIVVLVIFVGIVAIAVSGFESVPQEERWVIERFGKFNRVIGPGLRWIIPFKIEQVRAAVDIREQPIDLFEEEPWLDFRTGGSAQLVNPIIWVRVINCSGGIISEDAIRDSIIKMIYGVQNWRDAIRENTDNTLRAFFKSKSVEEMFSENIMGTKSWWEIAKNHTPDLEAKIASWGWEVTKINISDFKWSDEVVKIRKDVYQQQRNIKMAGFKAEAAKYEALQRALESGGTHGEIRQLLVDRYGYTKKSAEAIATQLVTYFRGTETGRIIDWRGGGEDLGATIARIMMAVQMAKDTFEKRTEREEGRKNAKATSKDSEDDEES